MIKRLMAKSTDMSGSQQSITAYMGTSNNQQEALQESPDPAIYQNSKRKLMSSSPHDSCPLVMQRENTVSMSGEQFTAIMGKLALLDTISKSQQKMH